MDLLLSGTAVLVCFALTVNIGGNNSAAEMAPSYGAGVASQKESLVLIAIFSLIGALVAGRQVVTTVASGIVSNQVVHNNPTAALIILGSAMSIIAIANCLKLPIAASHATVGALIGLGLTTGGLQWGRVVDIIGWWILTPAVSFAASYGLGWFLAQPIPNGLSRLAAWSQSSVISRIYLTASGCFLAFSAGSNGLAKAVGPLIGTGIIPYQQAALLGGVGLAVGALVIGPGVLETVGKKILPMNVLTAVLVQTISGSILLAASLAGIPISVAEVVTCSVIGFSVAAHGQQHTWGNRHVNRILKLWLLCPFFTALTSFLISSLVLTHHQATLPLPEAPASAQTRTSF